MNFKDLMAFVKAGYKPADIKELLGLVTPEETGTEKAPETDQKDDTQPEEQKDKPEESESRPDDQINQLHEKIDQLQKQLNAAQQKNTQQDLSGNEPDPQTNLNDIMRSFM